MQIFRQVENQGWSACLLACRRRELGSGRYSIIIKVGTYLLLGKEGGRYECRKFPFKCYHFAIQFKGSSKIHDDISSEHLICTDFRVVKGQRVI